MKTQRDAYKNELLRVEELFSAGLLMEKRHASLTVGENLRMMPFRMTIEELREELRRA